MPVEKATGVDMVSVPRDTLEKLYEESLTIHRKAGRMAKAVDDLLNPPGDAVEPADVPTGDGDGGAPGGGDETETGTGDPDGGGPDGGGEPPA